MNKFLFFLTLILIFTSCSQKREIAFFNGLAMSLNDDETIIKIDNNNYVFDKYTGYLDETAQLQTPLYKCVKHPDYFIYIGLPLNSQMSDFFNGESFVSTKDILENKSDSLSFSFKRYQDKKEFISKYIFKKSENILLVLGITNSRIISDSLLNHQVLSQKFTENQD